MPSEKAIMLVIGHVWPEPGTTAAGIRMIQLLNLFLELGYEITFASASARTKYSEDLSTMGISEQAVKLNDPEFDRFLQQLNPDIVLFDRFMTEEQFGWRVSDILPDCLRILNTEDLHSLRTAREKCQKENFEFTVKYWLNSDLTKRELASIYRSDVSLVISRYEMRFLQEEASIPSQLLFYLPFVYDPELLKGVLDTPGFKERTDYIFVGNGRHHPNIDAISWLAEDIWPGIREKLPEARLHIYGAYLPDSIKTLGNDKKGIIIEGHISELGQVMRQARVNLVPLRYGAGLKGKFFDAMINGTPSIATSVGWEGICEDHKNQGISPNNPNGFIERSVTLYKQETEWTVCRRKDQQLLRNGFNASDHKEKLKKKILDLKQHIQNHRLENVVGALLMHQSMASTKYMSRWIEAKNKLQQQGSQSSH